ncbi:MAG TPA: prephenate dehydratase domain-containing protein, partial [Solirubrobacteraceae bacterium]
MASEGLSENPSARVPRAVEEVSRGSRIVSKVGYLGPEGTFSEEALLSSAITDSVEPVPQASIYDTIMVLRHGDVEFAIVPIENSLDGSISVTLDLLADEAPGL